MAPSTDRSTPSIILKADYVGPDSTTMFTQTLPSASVSTTKEKTQYLAALRESIVKLQSEVNSSLTKKMEEDNKASTPNVWGKTDEKTEEENYGEEPVDEER